MDSLPVLDKISSEKHKSFLLRRVHEFDLLFIRNSNMEFNIEFIIYLAFNYFNKIYFFICIFNICIYHLKD